MEKMAKNVSKAKISHFASRKGVYVCVFACVCVPDVIPIVTPPSKEGASCLMLLVVLPREGCVLL